MADFTVRSDSIDVEDIMRRIRARIQEKRGTDYTDEQIRQLATVKLEKFLDPRVVRSELLEYYRNKRPPVVSLPAFAHELPPPFEHAGNYVFDQDTIYASSRSASGRIIAAVRRLLNPILKLFFNPGPIIHVLHMQSQLNEHYARVNERLYEYYGRRLTLIAEQLETIRLRLAERDALRGEIDLLSYEMLHNLVLEMTRVGIESKNLKMRVESLSTRLDFDERRSRALEGVVQYRPAPPKPAAQEADETQAGAAEAARSRRRRRRRRRGGGGATSGEASRPTESANAAPDVDVEDGSSDEAIDTAPPPEAADVSAAATDGDVRGERDRGALRRVEGERSESDERESEPSKTQAADEGKNDQ